MSMAALQDEDTQCKGMVVVVYIVGPNAIEAFDVEVRKKFASLSKALPTKINATHFCYSDVRLLPVVSLVQMVFPKEMRLRYRSHFGEFWWHV
jgi:hypothetical protein